MMEGFAANAAPGDRHDDLLIVNVKPGKPSIRDTIPHNPPPMHEARRRLGVVRG
jgi:hypothetical protein